MSTILPCSSQLRPPDQYKAEILGSASFGNTMPFWMVSNRFGKRVPYPYSSYFSFKAVSNFVESNRYWSDNNTVDIGYGIEGMARYSQQYSKLYIHQAYVEVNFGDFIGRFGSKEFNYQDKEGVATGHILASRNNRPIPRIVFRTEDYVPFPWFNIGDYFSIDLGYQEALLEEGREGWVPIERAMDQPYLHHKYFYGKGHINNNFDVFGGFHHTAIWGGEYDGVGRDKGVDLNYFQIITGRIFQQLVKRDEAIDLPANHFLSKELGVSYFPNGSERISWGSRQRRAPTQLKLYWQTIEDNFPGWIKRNVTDGLLGFEWVNGNSDLYAVKKVVFEFLNATSGESYFDHSMYCSGYTYYGYTIGTPFITSPIITGNDYTVQNSSLRAYYISMKGGLGRIRRRFNINRETWVNYQVVASFSKNYFSPSNPSDSEDAFSIMTGFDVPIRVNRDFYFNLGVEIAADMGSMYGSNYGVLLSVYKDLNLREESFPFDIWRF